MERGRERRSQGTPGRGYRLLFAALLIGGWAAAAIVAVGAVDSGCALRPVCFWSVSIPGALVSYAVLPPASRIDGRLRAVLAVSLSVAIALLLGLGLALVSDHISRVAAAVGLAVGADRGGGDRLRPR